ncbi:MAG: hypothetical protein F6K40_37460 [Okeania sp. SIO3I5]|nr:ion channel [Okeania sp. SIO3I5]NEQ41580.1 hypothetical protein [Okeania sp. SIO3I5]
MTPDSCLLTANIPAVIWWVIITFTTIDYRDIYPITPSGRF